LGLELKEGVKLSDVFCHYPKSDTWAVVEYENYSIRKATEQLDDTIKELRGLGHKVDEACIVLTKIKEPEKRLYWINPKTHELCNKWNRQPIQFRTSVGVIKVKVFYKEQVDRDYQRPIQTKLGVST